MVTGWRLGAGCWVLVVWGFWLDETRWFVSLAGVELRKALTEQHYLGTLDGSF